MSDLLRLTKILKELSVDDIIIERIEIIDMISPQSRTKETMKPHMKYSDGEISNSESGYSTTTLKEIFGIYNQGEFFDLLGEYSTSDFPSAPLRSLSIPLTPGLSGAWAPNGYGKTFAMKNILSKLQQAKGNNSLDAFDDFMYKCTSFREKETEGLFQSGWQSDGLGRYQPVANIQRNRKVGLIPFREINILLSTGHVIRYLPQYDEDGNYSHETFTKICKKKYDETFVNLYDGVKVPTWLCHTKGDLLTSTEMLDTWDDEEEDVYFAIQDRCFEIILSLALDYIEIPRLSYEEGTFEKISDGFKRYFSGLIVDFETEHGALDDYGKLDLVDLLSSQSLIGKNHLALGYSTKVLSDLDDFINRYSDLGRGEYNLPNIEYNLKKIKQSQGPRRMMYIEKVAEEISKGLEDCITYENIPVSQLYENFYLAMLKEMNSNFFNESTTVNLFTSYMDRLNSNMSDSHDPWSIKVKLLNWKVEANSNVFAFEYENGSENNQYRATWDMLSFGQKSHFIIQSMLILEEGLNQNESESSLQRCLVIDEPESGKAESWVSQLIADLQAQHNRLNDRKKSSVLILSHRGVVLDSITEDGVYSLMFTPEIDENMDEDEED